MSTKRSKKLTLIDVAIAAGVSPITVSRTLRSPGIVSPKVRDRVLQVIEEMGYVPDPAARALASHRSDVIGVIIPSITNAVFADVLRGIYAAAEDAKVGIQLGNTRYSTLLEEQLLRVFLNQKPAGLIVTGIDQSVISRALLSKANCPVVQIMDTSASPVDMTVGFSHVEAARTATRHLVESGYRRIAFLGARMDPRTQRRLEGFAWALKDAGLYDNRLVVTTPQASSVGLGCALLTDLLVRAPDADAVFCNNDDLALGVLFECQRRRLDVPSAFGICGFNDLEMTAFANPSITTVRTFREDIGRKSMEMLLARLTGDTIDQPILDVGFDLIVRQSTRRE